MRKMKGLSLVEAIASICLFGLGLFHGIRGLFWLLADENTQHDSPLYTSLSSIMPLNVWGFLIFLSGLSFVFASWKLPKHQVSNALYIFLLIGGLLSSLLCFAIALIGYGNAINWLTPSQLIVLSGVGGMLAFFGGMTVWQRNM